MPATVVTSKFRIIFFILFIMGVFLISILLMVAPAFAFETQITTSTYDQEYPAIYGNKIVWQDWRNGSNYDIYMYDLSTGQESVVTTATNDQLYPAIYGNKVVWQDYRNGPTPDIYMYDLTTGQESVVTTATYDQKYPAIYGDKVVWQDYRNGPTPDIYMYDLITGQESVVTTATYNQAHPAIYGNKIVWQDHRSGTNDDIYMYDLSIGQESVVSTATGNQVEPAIYGNKVVWEDYRNGSDLDIYMYDLSTGQESVVTTATGNQLYPAIYGDKVVWQDYRNGPTPDIYMYDLSTNQESVVTTATYDQEYTAIYGNKVVWEDYRNVSDYNIYMNTLPTGPRAMASAEGWDSGIGNWDWSGSKVASGDFNGDGLMDLVAFYGYSATRQTKAWVFINDGHGGYNTPIAWWDSGPNNWDWDGTKLIVGDFNGDALADIGALYGYAIQHQSRVFIFTSNGSNAFNNPTTWWDSGPGNWDWAGTKLTSGDYNGDGVTDIGALYGYATQHQSRAFIFTSNGINSFNGPTTWWDSGPGNWDWDGTKLSSGDYNADGLSDLSALYGYQSEHQTRAFVFTSNGINAFNTPTTWWDSGPGNWDWDGSTPLSGDFSGDGQDDLAVFYGYGGNQTKIWEFDSHASAFGSPYAAWDSGVGNWSYSQSKVVAGDTNSDGCDDIVAFYNYPGQQWTKAFNLK